MKCVRFLLVSMVIHPGVKIHASNSLLNDVMFMCAKFTTAGSCLNGEERMKMILVSFTGGQGVFC